MKYNNLVLFLHIVDKESVICKTCSLPFLIEQLLSVSKSAIKEEESHFVDVEGKKQATIKC